MHPRLFAESRPSHPAIVMNESGETVTYGALEAAANRGAQLFRKQGLKAGDTVAVWMENNARFLEIYWAAQRAGLYLTPISTRLTAGEAAYIVNDCGARLLVTSTKIGEAARETVEARDSLIPHVEAIYSVGETIAGTEDWSEACAHMPDEPIDDESAGYHVVYSSGTTGKPKGIRLPLSGGPAIVEHPFRTRFMQNYGASEDTHYLSPAPLYHTAPLVYCTVMHGLGATVVIMEHFEPEGALAAIEKHRITFTQMVPTMFVRMLKLPEEARKRYDLSSLTCVLHAAAPCPVPVKQQMIEWLGPIIAEYYGSSEGAGSTTIMSDEWLKKPGSVGRASWCQLHICDEDGNELPTGTPGLIYFEGGLDFQYLNDDAKTRSTRHPQHPNWSCVGDIGYVDEDGYLFLTDRKAFMIISGGVNIYPQEAENLLIMHPKVADVAVIGVPNSDFGEEVKAVVQPADWAEAGPALAQELLAYCRAQLSAIKCPRSVDFEQELPRAATGKLYKKQIRDRYWPAAAL